MKHILLLASIVIAAACNENKANGSNDNTSESADSLVTVDTIQVDTSEEAEIADQEETENQRIEDAFLLVLDPEPEYEGSEDWGWFVYDVSRYAKYKGILTGGSIMYNFDSVDVETDDGTRYFDLTPFLENEARGYVLIHGKSSHFVQHDLPESVISQINEFFGIEGSLQDVPKGFD